MLEPKELLSFSDQEVPVCMPAKLLQSGPNLCDTRKCSPPGSSVHGILQARYWSGWPCPPPGDLPNTGTEPASLALQVDSLPTVPPGNPSGNIYYSANSHQNTIST